MNKVSLLIFSMGVSVSSLAGTMGPVESWKQVLTISMGPVWNESGSTQTFFLQPEIEKTYTADSSTKALFYGEVFYGGQHRINSTFVGQIGLAVAATTNATISGEIWDDADPAFNNYVYSYKINHAHVSARGKLIADMNFMVKPYVNASIGVGFNRAHGFTNEPTIFEAVENPAFLSNTQTAFTYTVGAGLQKSINDHWQAGIGYEFADWGRSKLGLAPDQTTHSSLTESHLYTNGLLLSLSYLG